MMADSDEFRQFVLTRGPALSRTAYLLTGDHAAAEDLVQEVLIKTAARWSRIRAAGDPEPWVRRVMLNELRTLRRPRRLTFISAADVPERGRPTDEAARVDLKLALLGALSALAPRQRAVLYLRFYEDLTEVEVARQLGCSVGAVKRSGHDALQRLRVLAPQLLSFTESREVRS
jgi:RNA polymerase sigma-70 factor (sigma-E family)